jgi:hypothetical protein
MGENGYRACTKSRTSQSPRKFFKLIAEIDEFKGRWTAIETLAPEKLTSLPADRHH